MRRRAAALLAKLAPEWQLPPAGDRLRGVRAGEVLERVGTAEARELLGAWRRPTRDPRLSAEAASALARLP